MKSALYSFGEKRNETNSKAQSFMLVSFDILTSWLVCAVVSTEVVDIDGDERNLPT